MDQYEAGGEEASSLFETFEFLTFLKITCNKNGELQRPISPKQHLFKGLKVICLLDDPVLSRSLGKEVRRFVLERYDWNFIGLKYLARTDFLVSGLII